MDPISAFVAQQQLGSALAASESALIQVRAIDLSSQLTAATHGVEQLLEQIHLTVAQAHAQLTQAAHCAHLASGANPISAVVASSTRTPSAE